MRYEHFLPFIHGIVRTQSECPASRQAGSYIGGVASSFQLSYWLKTRDARYSYVDRVLFTPKSISIRKSSNIVVV